MEQIHLSIKDWNIERETGYKPLTTSYSDLSIADAFGEQAVIDTYKSLKSEFLGDYKLLTELTMALNWKIFEHYGRNDRLARLYDKMWREMDSFCIDTFNDDEISYYYQTTD